MFKYRLLVHSASQVVTVRNDAKIIAARGQEMRHVDIVEGTEQCGVSVLIDSNGKIAFVGLDTDVAFEFPDVHKEVERTIDARGKSIVPGLVDAHTHPVWVGDRVHEFAMKLAGATYMEVHAAGGGIHYTVEKTRNASEEELYCSLVERLYSMLSTGTTCVECKSGYGLEVDTEIKMLSVIEKARKEVPISISCTYCGAHAVPKGKTSQEATDDVINHQIPKIRELMSKEELHVDNIDVFCEKGVFDVNQSRRILQAGKDAGMNLNFHGDELSPLDGAKMGAELGALAISHLEEISDSGIDAMTKVGSVGVVLPTTAYILRLTPPPVRKMIESGMAVALGSDFNPNAYCMSMPMVMHLACVIFRMSMPEALVAATLNSAAALGRSGDLGTLSVGKCGDMVIINAPRWEHLVYQFGCHNQTISSVIRNGEVVLDAGQCCG
ncbi:hypothetical protein FSP39_000365 [Pinctada imbricata]|uniref:Probable imidazolonepropionase n=1 Tax=Pinctada imbricata TaxID=66713 RepID=A0AA88Y9H5_PINIB|nr:hypothetical protein FSP39_000365 [Pinctada imbricata]